jgi:osmotically-inducible protein OsmY
MTRNDTEIQHDVIDELQFEPSVDASKIGVAASGGIVTLTGSVPSYAEKIAAEEAALRVLGVQAIANDLKIDLPQSHERTDTDIASSAVNVLQWDSSLPRNQITVKVSNGFVTLDGEVEWQYQKDRARTLVQSISGVRGVTSNITLKPRVLVGDVKMKIRQAFERSAETDANQIQIEAHDGTVVLRGPVHSWAEKQDATRAAYSVPGVKVVENLTQMR